MEKQTCEVWVETYESVNSGIGMGDFRLMKTYDNMGDAWSYAMQWYYDPNMIYIKTPTGKIYVRKD